MYQFPASSFLFKPMTSSWSSAFGDLVSGFVGLRSVIF
jgi:hypothetical protein